MDKDSTQGHSSFLFSYMLLLNVSILRWRLQISIICPSMMIMWGKYDCSWPKTIIFTVFYSNYCIYTNSVDFWRNWCKTLLTEETFHEGSFLAVYLGCTFTWKIKLMSWRKWFWAWLYVCLSCVKSSGQTWLSGGHLKLQVSSFIAHFIQRKHKIARKSK